MSLSTIKFPAFAKINWTLRVLGKRADGYHEIDTILQTISLHDTLTVSLEKSGEILLSCDDPSLPVGEENLVWRAATMMKARHEVSEGARIHLEKRIPVEAGLGGGSSDAVAVLFNLASLWNASSAYYINEVDVFKIAAELGSDLPFFFSGGRGRATQRGNYLTGLPDIPETFLLVLKPNCGISTARAYRELNAPALTTSGAKTILSGSQGSGFSGNFGTDALQNDFEATVFRLAPEVERAKAALIGAGARAASLTGSGSAVFGIFDNREAQERAIQDVKLESGWRVFPCNTVGRDHYRSAIAPWALF